METYEVLYGGGYWPSPITYTYCVVLHLFDYQRFIFSLHYQLITLVKISMCQCVLHSVACGEAIKLRIFPTTEIYTQSINRIMLSNPNDVKCHMQCVWLSDSKLRTTTITIRSFLFSFQFKFNFSRRYHYSEMRALNHRKSSTTSAGADWAVLWSRAMQVYCDYVETWRLLSWRSARLHCADAWACACLFFFMFCFLKWAFFSPS